MKLKGKSAIVTGAASGIGARIATLFAREGAHVAIVHAFVCDYLGNLTYVLTARNFNPAMATAADKVLVHAEHVVPVGGLQVDQHGLLANWMIPGKMVPGMGGAMDLVTGAKRVFVAMQHSAKGKSKIVRQISLPLTSVRTVDLVVTELAVIGFPEGRATLLETAPGVSVDQVLAATEAELVVPGNVPQMAI